VDCGVDTKELNDMNGEVEFFTASQRGKGSTEFADSLRGLATFPAEWGMPEGTKWSEERAAWVRARVEDYERDPMRNLARTATRLRNAMRLADVEDLRADE
jgi:hypothetical protein